MPLKKRKNVNYPASSDLSPNKYLGRRILARPPWEPRQITEIETRFWDDDDTVAGWWITWEDDAD